MTLLLNQIFTNAKSGIVRLEVPILGEYNSEDTGTAVISGILASDPRIAVQNQWGNILPGTDDLNTVLSALGSQNLFSWVSASAAAWKSCDPISVSLDFYLISYNKNSRIKSQVSSLMSLAGLTPGNQDGTFSGETMVKVHGGYKLDILDSNQAVNKDNILSYITPLSSKGKRKGTISISIGDQIHVNNLLLQECYAEPSTVQVDEGVPLYIKVSTVLRMYRAPLVSDIVGIFS